MRALRVLGSGALLVLVVGCGGEPFVEATPAGSAVGASGGSGPAGGSGNSAGKTGSTGGSTTGTAGQGGKASGGSGGDASGGAAGGAGQAGVGGAVGGAGGESAGAGGESAGAGGESAGAGGESAGAGGVVSSGGAGGESGGAGGVVSSGGAGGDAGAGGVVSSGGGGQGGAGGGAGGLGGGGAGADCGDGLVDPAEECDDGNTTNNDGCSSTCTNEKCGDGVVQSGEECDDGNNDSTDACTNACLHASCGDGFVQVGQEACDDGNTINGDGCSSSCLFDPLCGDGAINPGEECDDGNTDDTDACTSGCKIAVCGDGFVQAGHEQCDDGNLVSTDACTDQCKAAVCGDGVVHKGVEDCDDGNLSNGDGCTALCKLEFCGDGVVLAPEACDDGDHVASPGCNSICLVPTCGDGIVDYLTGESCDAGGTVGGLCGAGCVAKVASCGDGVVDVMAGEQCDYPGDPADTGACDLCKLVGPDLIECGDGNVGGRERCDDKNSVNGDGCNPTCTLTTQVSTAAGDATSTVYADGDAVTAVFGSGDGIIAMPDALYVADGASQTLRKITFSDAKAGALDKVSTLAGAPLSKGWVDASNGLNARFSSLGAITTDGYTIWVADEGNHVIRAVSLTPPHAVTTVAGSGSQGHADGTGVAAKFDGLRGLTYHNGFVYLLDGTQSTLRRFDPKTGAVTTIAGQKGVKGSLDGVGLGATFQSPRYMVSDTKGKLFVSDTNGYSIRVVDVSGAQPVVTTFAGVGGTCISYNDGMVGAAAAVHRPRGITTDGQSLFWVEFEADTIRQGVIATGVVTTLAGAPRDCAKTCTQCGASSTVVLDAKQGQNARFRAPFAIAFHEPSRSLFTIDASRTVRRIE